MTATEMIPAVGAVVMVRFEEMNFTCQIVDVKFAWGKPRLQVKPANGTGLQWVELSRVTKIDPTQGLAPRGWDRV